MAEDHEIDVPDEVVKATDQWMRFDLWSARAWEATQYALHIVRELASDGPMDNRAVTAFIAAETAKEFAAMTNPLSAPGGGAAPQLSDAQAQAIMAMVFNDED